MKDLNEEAIERLIRQSAFPNPVHKAALREKLFGHARTLDLDELAAVAGGVSAHSETEPDRWETFPPSEVKPS